MKAQNRTPRSQSWHWPWIGFASALIIWLASDIYFNRIIEIETIGLDTTDPDDQNLIQQYKSSLVYTKVGSSIIAIVSFVLLWRKMKLG
ncbi:hypothetical protein OAI07_00860 [Akkermansiaceae bacterium]|nr:hypothetical protein [Akkermansiaceae bacterium]